MILRSHLTRGAWIEIKTIVEMILTEELSHLTRGAWIEMFSKLGIGFNRICRTSHEVRGLKFE